MTTSAWLVRLRPPRPGSSDSDSPCCYLCGLRFRYIGLVAKHHMYDRLKMQSEAFVRGFREVLDPVFLQVSTHLRSISCCSQPQSIDGSPTMIPLLVCLTGVIGMLVQMFNEPELQILISGSPSGIDVEDMRAHTQYTVRGLDIDMPPCTRTSFLYGHTQQTQAGHHIGSSTSSNGIISGSCLAAKLTCPLGPPVCCRAGSSRRTGTSVASGASCRPSPPRSSRHSCASSRGASITTCTSND